MRTACVVVVAVVAFGCQRRPDVEAESASAGTALTGEQRAAVDAALQSFGKVEAAAQVGITRARYAELLAEAKAAVNEAERVLPDGELKSNISAAMLAYADAGTVWEWQGLELREKHGHGHIIARYKLPLQAQTRREKIQKEYGLTVRDDGPSADPEIAIQIIWKTAAEKLTAARKAAKP